MRLPIYKKYIQWMHKYFGQANYSLQEEARIWAVGLPDMRAFNNLYNLLVIYSDYLWCVSPNYWKSIADYGLIENLQLG